MFEVELSFVGQQLPYVRAHWTEATMTGSLWYAHDVVRDAQPLYDHSLSARHRMWPTSSLPHLIPINTLYVADGLTAWRVPSPS